MQNAYASGKIHDPNYHEDLKFCQQSVELTSSCTTSARPLTDERNPRKMLSQSNPNLSANVTPLGTLTNSSDTVAYKPKQAIAPLKVAAKPSQKLTLQSPNTPMPSKVAL
jgi:hypothetical protein